MTTTVWVTHSFVGFHRWAGATGTRGYLAHRHRHLFMVRAEVAVHHDDRDVEFHDLLDTVTACCAGLGDTGPSGRELGSMSCEMVAHAVFDAIEKTWPGRATRVEISEDGEVGATVSV